MQKFSKSELQFLQKELLPLNLNSMKDCERKSQIESLVQMHNPKNIKDFSIVLNELSLSREAFFEKSFDDTLNYFFTNTPQIHYSRNDIILFKAEFLYLISQDIFSYSMQTIIANYFLMFLQHLNQTHETLTHMNYKSDQLGTAFFNNDYKVGLESTYNELKKQLDKNYTFSTSFSDDRDRVKLATFAIKTFRNHTPIANYMIILNSLYGFKNFDLDMTEGHKKGMEQVFKKLNGLKTSKQELIRSFTIKVIFPYKMRKINKTRLCDFIQNISRYFFDDIVYDKTLKQFKVGLSPRYLNNNVYIKTAVNENIIYAYDNKKEYCHLFKMQLDNAVEFFTDMMIELGHEDITTNKVFKPLMKKIFNLPMFPL